MAYYPFATEIGARYSLVGPDGSQAVFNDNLDPAYAGILTEVTGLDSADVRESAAELVEADGGTHGSFYLGRRPIVLTGKIIGHGSVRERTLYMDRARRASAALRADATLSWKPSTRRENFITNPRGALGTAGWSAAAGAAGVNAGGVLSQATAVAPPVGNTALRFVTSGAGSNNQGIWIPVNVAAGYTYGVSVAAIRTAGTGALTIDVATNGGPTVASAVTPAGWTVYTATFTATATGTTWLRAFSPNASTLASTFQISDVMVSNGTTAYFDGDSPSSYWQGDAYASASADFIEMFTLVRRQQPFRESGAWNKDIQIPLVAAYPYLYSTSVKTVATGVGAENRGSAPSYPVVTFTGPSTNPQLSDGTRTFKTMNMTGGTNDLQTGEQMQVDFVNHSAKFIAGGRNGQSANRYIDFANTTWPMLSGVPNQTTTFTLSGGGTASIQYRDAWF